MLRLSSIASLLDAVVRAGEEHQGADTALLTLYHTTELYAYASRDASDAPPSSRATGLMATTPDTLSTGEERARTYSAMAVAAWRKRMARLGRTAPAPTPRLAPRGRRECSPEVRTASRRLASSQRRDTSVGRSSGSRLQAPDSTPGNEAEERPPAPETDPPTHAETAPLLLETPHGRLLVAPVLIASLASMAEPLRSRRLHRASYARQDRSRRPSHTGSSDAAGGRPTPAILRSMGPLTDEGTDTGLSTEDELPSGADTDRDSVRSANALRGSEHGTVMLLTLRAPLPTPMRAPEEVHASQLPTDADLAHAEDPAAAAQASVWQTLLSQALCFSEANAPLSPATPHLRPPATPSA